MRVHTATQRFATLAVLFGLVAACGPTGVEVATSSSPSPKKKASTKPKVSPSASASASADPRASTSPSPAAGQSPSASPTASASTAVGASPSASPTASTLTSGSASPSASPSIPPVTGGWSGPATETEALAHIGFPFEPAGRSWTYEAALSVSGFPIKGTMVQTVETVDGEQSTLQLAFDIAGQAVNQSQDKKRVGTDSTTPPVYTKETVTVPAGTFDTILVVETIKGQPAKTWYDKVQGPVQATFEVPDRGPVTVKLKTFKAS